jgi:hypothetical protein
MTSHEDVEQNGRIVQKEEKATDGWLQEFSIRQ